MATIDRHTDRGSPVRTRPWWKKLGWLILIWTVGVATLYVVAEAIGLVMRSAGLTAG